LPLPQPATDLQPIACHPLDATVAIWQIPTALNKPQPKEMTNSSAQQRQDADRAKGFGVWHGIGAGDGIAELALSARLNRLALSPGQFL